MAEKKELEQLSDIEFARLADLTKALPALRGNCYCTCPGGGAGAGS